MTYKFKIGSKTIICKTLNDFPEESNVEIVDLTSISGKAIYKNLFGRKLFIDEMKDTPEFTDNSEIFQKILPTLDEKSKRIFAGYLATKYDIKTVAKMTSLDVKTIRRGKNEVESDNILPKGQIRRKGAGRKKN